MASEVLGVLRASSTVWSEHYLLGRIPELSAGSRDSIAQRSRQPKLPSTFSENTGTACAGAVVEA